MESSKLGFVGRLFEKVITWVVLAILLCVGFTLYKLGATGRQALMDALWKSTLWILVVAALPWSFQLFKARILEMGVNWVGLVVLGAFVLVDIIVGLILLGGAPPGLWPWLATLAVLGLATAYNFLVTEYISEQAGV
ncbi:MAG: hypothetical protein ABIG44_06925 [Planctomycetota bacterium]